MITEQEIKEKAKRHVDYIDDSGMPMERGERSLIEDSYITGYQQALEDIQEQKLRKRLDDIKEDRRIPGLGC